MFFHLIYSFQRKDEFENHKSKAGKYSKLDRMNKWERFCGRHLDRVTLKIGKQTSDPMLIHLSWNPNSRKPVHFKREIKKAR